MKILSVGDVHYTNRKPVGRVDDYKAAILNKLLQIAELSQNYDVTIFSGDIFDKPNVTGSFLDLYAVIKQVKNAYVVPGNHDIFGYNLNKIDNTALGLLAATGAVKLLYSDSIIETTKVVIAGQGYCIDVDENGFGYDSEHFKDGKLGIMVTHGMLLDVPMNIAKNTQINDVVTKADIVITGHYHPGFGIKERGSKFFCNVGAICRIEASKHEMEREIKVMSILVNDDLSFVIQETPLVYDKDVLSREHVEKIIHNKAVKSEFSAVLESKKSDMVFTSVEDLVLYVKQQAEESDDTVKIALDLIEARRRDAKG